MHLKARYNMTKIAHCLLATAVKLSCIRFMTKNQSSVVMLKNCFKKETLSNSKIFMETITFRELKEELTSQLQKKSKRAQNLGKKIVNLVVV